MSLRLKANLIFLAAAVIVLVVAAGALHYAAARDAVAAARREAGLLTAEAETAARYTREKVAPALAGASASPVFVPASAPFYAVETQARILSSLAPGYQIRRVVLAPTSDADRPDEWERAAILRLRAARSPEPFAELRPGHDGARQLVLVTPLVYSAGVCATCYTSRDAAPVAVVDAFGGAAGFDDKPGEIVGATIAAVPIAAAAPGITMTALAIVAVAVAVLLAALNLVLGRLVLTPLGRVVAVAEQVSLGKAGVQEFAPAGDDEIGTLTRSFNRLRRSMESAIGLIEP